MSSQLTTGTFFSLFGAIAALAAVPSVSVLTVSARAASLGFFHGALTTAGIVIGDLIFIALAVWGLAFFAAQLGLLFEILKGLGGLYLLWLGGRLWRSRPPTSQGPGTLETSWTSSLLAGLSITIGDQKAILFYLGFFPAFLDLDSLTTTDLMALMTIAAIAVGSVKLIYAYLAAQARSRIGQRLSRRLNQTAALIMIAIGMVLLAAAIASLFTAP